VPGFVIGCVIYAGKDTKMMLNSKYKSNKTSSVERVLNKIVLLSVASVVILTFLSFGLSFLYDDIYIDHWYLWDSEPEYFKDKRYLAKIITLVFYNSIFNFLVPMGLYVTLELQRFFGVKFFQFDIEMYDEENDRPAKANNSDLNEDLGQIEYLFSDKTGTLTVNEMDFKECFIGDSVFHENNGKLIKANSNEAANFNDKLLIRYFEVLILCHSIQLDVTNSERFQASNPDELSFIRFCESIGIFYKGEFKCQQTHRTYRSVNLFGKVRNYEVMRILDFDSYRKRMSIIVRCLISNKIILLCKGAENLVIDRCLHGNFNACTRQANRFAKNGWRTLAVAYKYLTIDEFNEYECLLNDAYNDLDCREEKLTLIYNLIEKDLTLLGVTSVEDKLQEDCAETMNSLKQAGIRIWVLTGDKKETALSVSKLSNHVTREMEILDFTEASADSLLFLLYESFKRVELETNSKFALIIDGRSLTLYLDNYKAGLSKELINLCLKCKAVICCRLSPLQKAQIVQLVKNSNNFPITAAIGDGANDVSMIQEAHIGIGIFGKEGKSAAISSDFAFSKFKYLKRAILVHGFLYYTRLAIFSQYFFYKTLVFVICQFYYAFYAAFSTQSLYNSIVLTLYNSVLTSLPVLVFGLFEQKYSIDKIKSNPNYYRLNFKNELLSKIQLFKWTLLSIWHSLVAFYFTYGLWLCSSLNVNGTVS
jgi:phospholipid-translocating ATPase